MRSRRLPGLLLELVGLVRLRPRAPVIGFPVTGVCGFQVVGLVAASRLGNSRWWLVVVLALVGVSAAVRAVHAVSDGRVGAAGPTSTSRGWRYWQGQGWSSLVGLTVVWVVLFTVSRVLGRPVLGPEATDLTAAAAVTVCRLAAVVVAEVHARRGR